MTETLNLPQIVSAARADEFAAAANSGASTLYVPSKVSFKGTVAASLATQAVITWGTKPAAAVLQTNLDVDAPRVSEALERNAPLLTAIHLARTVIDAAGNDITDRARALAEAATASSSDLPQLGTGVSVGTNRTVMAVDHIPDFEKPRGLYPHPALDEAARPFYAGYDRMDVSKLRGRAPLGHRALGVGPLNPEGFGDKYSATGRALGMLLFELVQNTDLHARRTARGHTLPKSVRLVQLRGYSQTRTTMSQTSDRNDLSNYYQRVPSVGGDDQLRFLTVSVLDSGPGLARTLLARENEFSPTPDKELEYFLRALRMTSRGRTREPMRGMGLRRVQRFLSALGGYARIRSGRFEVYRDFTRFPYLEGADDERFWYGGLQRPSESPMLAGTSFTLVIPLPPLASTDTLWEVAGDD